MDILHVRDLAQALDHRVVVYDDHGLVAFEARQPMGHLASEIEILAFPVARQVLPPSQVDRLGVDEGACWQLCRLATV